MLFEERERFMELFVTDIAHLIARARKKRMRPCVRPNGTSDLRFEDWTVRVSEALSALLARRYRVRVKPGVYANIFACFPRLQFYDYTKIGNRRRALTVPNYHLTFSYSAAAAYQTNVERALANYGDRVNMAVVFKNKNRIPREFLGRPVVDGDSTDLRFLDAPGHIVALSKKGRARDTSFFVLN
jgi:hypothetical protein